METHPRLVGQMRDVARGVTDVNRKKKVAQVITRMDWGGSPDIVRILCSYLDPAVYDVRLIVGKTLYPTEKTKQFFERFKDRLTIIPPLQRNINPFLDLLAFLRLYSLFQRERFDIIHTHTAKAGALGRIAAALSGCRVIIHTPHGHNFYGYFAGLASKIIVSIERFLSRFTDKIIALTELEKQDFMRFRVVKENKVSVIYQGLELEAYSQSLVNRVEMRKTFNINADELAVGMVARLEPIKGPVYFIEAAREVAVKNDKARFIVIGEGSLRRSLEERVETLGLRERFRFSGWREDIPIVISLLDVLVLPSLNEAVGMVVIEAQAAGVPVVATRVGGIPEIVKDNENGLLVPPADPLEIAKAVNSLLEDRQRRERFVKMGREQLEGKFRAAAMIKSISELYEELLKKRLRA